MPADFDLSDLPAPSVIETIDFEAILAAELADLRSRAPVFDATVESDPAYKLLEVASYREILLRQRLNDVARRRLLAYAADGDLDQLAAFYGVVRLVIDPGSPNATPPIAPTYEADDAFRARVRDRIAGSSAAGSVYWYRYYARSADARVKSAAVDSPAGGLVRVSILSTAGDGTPSEDLLAAVRAVVLSPQIKALCHTVTVVGAEILPVSVTASIKLLPSSSQSDLSTIEANFRTAFAAASGLGWDVTRSWIIARLQTAGVHSVSLGSPAADVLAAPNQAPYLASVVLSFAGWAE